jgi:hypothetical protein
MRVMSLSDVGACCLRCICPIDVGDGGVPSCSRFPSCQLHGDIRNNLGDLDDVIGLLSHTHTLCFCDR